MSKIMTIALVLILSASGLFIYKGQKSQQIKFASTLNESKLAGCGEKPNCVSSFAAESDEHYYPAKEIEIESLEKIKLPNNCTRKQITTNYLYAECTSSLFKFVDDLELIYLPDSKLLHYRSASRVGYSDLGANRKRIDHLLELNK